ncbi:MAG: hypothetical protein RQ885_15490 [Desulfurococcales archaeon]|nr:hypothetical protein [Desulfurococcales archaeon]
MCLAYRYPWRAMMLELSSDRSPMALRVIYYRIESRIERRNACHKAHASC